MKKIVIVLIVVLIVVVLVVFCVYSLQNERFTCCLFQTALPAC